MQGIYRIRNKLNGKYYVGSAKDIKERLDSHNRALLKGGGSPHLQNAWNKYGAENFILEILEEVKGSRDAAYEQEQEYLDDGFSRGVLYNVSTHARGGDSPGQASRMWGKRRSIETRQKIGRANSGRKNGMFGKQHTEEWKRAHKERFTGKNHPNYGKPAWNKGIPHSKEHCRRISEARKGFKFSDATKQKMSESAGKPYPAFFNELTGETIPAGINLTRTCEEYGLSFPVMWNVKARETLCTEKGWRLVTKGEIQNYDNS